MVSKYRNRGKYLYSDPVSGKVLFRDKIAENKIKRSYKFRQLEKRLQRQQEPPKENFFEYYDLPEKAAIGSSAIDNAEKLWTYTKNGWQTNAYDTYGISFMIDEELPRGIFLGQTWGTMESITGMEYMVGRQKHLSN